MKAYSNHTIETENEPRINTKSKELNRVLRWWGC